MRLSIRVPYGPIVEVSEVQSLNLDTTEGSMGLLPHRLDFVAAIVPGILTYTTADQPEAAVALDQGVITKAGDEVQIIVRQAVPGKDWDQLHRLVNEDFLGQSEQERAVRAVLARLEATFFHRFSQVHHG
jgi:F-type H+-transporting ATPase subunit epsilon